MNSKERYVEIEQFVRETNRIVCVNRVVVSVDDWLIVKEVVEPTGKGLGQSHEIDGVRILWDQMVDTPEAVVRM